MLKIQNLYIKRNHRNIIKNINLELNYGDAVWIGGDNGAGKSTLLKTIAGIYKNQTGTITYNNFDINHHEKEYQELILYQPDIPLIDQNLTIRENLLIWGDISGRSITIDAVLHSLNLLNQSNEKAFTLSRGQLQRLHLARLLLKDAELWLLDEPTAHMDEYWINYLVKLIHMHIGNAGIVVYTSQYKLNINSEKSLILPALPALKK